jgi:aminopeptidase N
VFDARVRPDLVNVDAEKMLLCIKTETGKTNKELAFQFHNAPLYPDRTEALFGLLNDLKSPEYLECLVTALDDKYWELRLLAISGLSDVVVGHEKMIKEKLMKIAGTDPKSLVRAEAITVLSRNFKNADLISFYKGALKDQSYAVMGNALVAIDKLDSMQSAKIAKGLEGEKNEQLITTVLYIYSRSGSDENLDFFIQAVDQFKSYSKITYASLLGDFLKRCKDESVNKALPVLETLCKDSNKYVKFYGKKTIQDLSDMYEKREKSGVAGAGLQKMKMDDFLKTLE